MPTSSFYHKRLITTDESNLCKKIIKIELIFVAILERVQHPKKRKEYIVAS